MKSRAGASAAAGCLLFAGAALATPSALFGPGPRSQALGGTGAATRGDVEAAATNPASLDGERPQVLVGYRATRWALEARPFKPERGALGAGLLGLTLPLFHGEERSLVLGVLTAAPRELVVSAKLPPPEAPQFPLLVERARALDLALGLGARAGAVALGVGLRALAGLEGHALVGEASAEVHNTLDPAAAPVVALWVAPSTADSLALVGRAALSAEFDVELDVSAFESVRLPKLELGGVAHYDPAELHAEWRHDFGATRSTRLALGLTYRRWSAFPGWLSETAPCEAPGCESRPKEVVELSDTFVPRVGLEQELELAEAVLHFRAGYFFEASPLEEQRGLENRFDNARHALGLGYAIKCEGYSLALSYQLNVLVSREHKKGPRASAEQPGVTRVKSEGTLQVLSIAVGGSL